MARFNFRRVLGAAATFALLLTPVAASAASWTPEGVQHWIEVAHRLNAAANASEAAMGAACQGVTLMGGGSELRHEAGVAPTWAVMAHLQVCVGYQSYAGHETGHTFQKSNNPCRNILSGIDQLGHAKAGMDPDDVVAAASQLSATLQTLVGDMKDAKSCKFKRNGMF